MTPDVVVVDDELPIVELVCDVLTDEAITAEGCPHDQALSCIRRKRPKAVILDIQMPGVDGIEVFQQLRAEPATADIPVIFFTANADRLYHWFPKFEELGAILLPKPFDLTRLVATVTRTLDAA